MPKLTAGKFRRSVMGSYQCRDQAGLLRAETLDQYSQFFMFGFGAGSQWRTDRASIVTYYARTGLDDTDGIAGLAVADFQVRQEEIIDQLTHGSVVFLGDGMVKIHRCLRNEVEYRRGVHRYTQGLVSSSIDFCRRQATEVSKTVA